MKLDTLAPLLGLTLVLAGGVAAADPLVRVRRAQFTDRIDHAQPVGDAASLAGAERAAYWFEVSNPGQPTTVTVVWRVDGREAARQSLEVGHAPRWRTWAYHRLHGAHHIAVEVLDAAGETVHRDEVNVSR